MYKVIGVSYDKIKHIVFNVTKSPKIIVLDFIYCLMTLNYMRLYIFSVICLFI